MEWNGLVEEVKNPWSYSVLTNDGRLDVQAPTPGKKAEVLTHERIQSKGEHKTFDIPSNLYFMM